MNAVLSPPPATAVRGLSLVQVMERATALQAAGKPLEAAALYGQWVREARAPMKQIACFNQGTLLSSLHRDDEAEACYRQALKLAPDFAPAHLNLGHLQERHGDPQAALASWARAIALTDPPSPATIDHHLHALNNSARLLEHLKRFPEAEALMVRSLQHRATQPDVIQHYVHIRQKQCEWPLYQPVGEVTVNQLLTGTSALAMMGISDDPALQLLSAMRFAQERVPRPSGPPLHTQVPARKGRVRVGYLSGDLHHHAVGLLIAELIELHDRERFEVFAFCWTPESGTPQRQRLLRAFDHHVPLAGIDDATAARRIAEAGIDVLVDLQALTSGARPAILAHRPAPVQVSYLGLPGTSALPGVDWLVADAFTLPESLEPYCTERPIRLPTVFQVSDRQREEAAPPTRAKYGLPEDAVVYCSFNNNHKFTPEVFGLWMDVLRAVPGSVLWLLADNATCRTNMEAAATAAGVDPGRLHFAPRVSPPEYLARFRLADLMLDTFPYNAGTTASDALWMGLPILTRAGRTYISRMAGSLLHAVGLPELIVETPEAYRDLAITLGRHPARLASYKRYLAEHGRSSPLFDVPRIVRELESAFEDLALRARAGAPGPWRA